MPPFFSRKKSKRRMSLETYRRMSFSGCNSKISKTRRRDALSLHSCLHGTADDVSCAPYIAKFLDNYRPKSWSTTIGIYYFYFRTLRTENRCRHMIKSVEAMIDILHNKNRLYNAVQQQLKHNKMSKEQMDCHLLTLLISTVAIMHTKFPSADPVSEIFNRNKTLKENLQFISRNISFFNNYIKIKMVT